MQIRAQRLTWPPPYEMGAATFGGQVMGNDPDEAGYKQPSLGFVIGWNRPQAHWWQPYVLIEFGFWHVNAGWLYD